MTSAPTPVTHASAIPAQTPDDHALFRKIAWRILPILILAFVVNYLDRVNVGFAGLTMRHDLGLTATQFGNAAGLLFLTYCLFEVPSNAILYKVGPRIWLTRIIITWGIISAATALVTGATGFYLVRLLLGAAEAGFTPGVIYLLHCWFPDRYRARAMAMFMMSVPLSSVIGGPISGWLMQMDGVAGLHGWAWLFIGEGLPAVLVGILLAVLIADGPAKARWLDRAEKERLDVLLPAPPAHRKVSLLKALKDKRVLMLAMVNFSYTLGSFGVSIWLPTILKGHHLATTTIGYLSAIPYICACFSVLFAGWAIDRGFNRVLALGLCCGAGALGLVFSMQFDSLELSMLGLTVAIMGVNSARSVFWTIPGGFLSGKAAASGFALINTIATFGGYFGPSMVGWFADHTGSFKAGVYAMAALLVLAVGLVCLVHSVLKATPRTT